MVSRLDMKLNWDTTQSQVALRIYANQPIMTIASASQFHIYYYWPGVVGAFSVIVKTDGGRYLSLTIRIARGLPSLLPPAISVCCKTQVVSL